MMAPVLELDTIIEKRRELELPLELALVTNKPFVCPAFELDIKVSSPVA